MELYSFFLEAVISILITIKYIPYFQVLSHCVIPDSYLELYNLYWFLLLSNSGFMKFAIKIFCSATIRFHFSFPVKYKHRSHTILMMYIFILPVFLQGVHITEIFCGLSDVCRDYTF